jgi:hypothetical protein
MEAGLIGSSLYYNVFVADDSRRAGRVAGLPLVPEAPPSSCLVATLHRSRTLF